MDQASGSFERARRLGDVDALKQIKAALGQAGRFGTKLQEGNTMLCQEDGCNIPTVEIPRWLQDHPTRFSRVSSGPGKISARPSFGTLLPRAKGSLPKSCKMEWNKGDGDESSKGCRRTGVPGRTSPSCRFHFGSWGSGRLVVVFEKNGKPG